MGKSNFIVFGLWVHNILVKRVPVVDTTEPTHSFNTSRVPCKGIPVNTGNGISLEWERNFYNTVGVILWSYIPWNNMLQFRGVTDILSLPYTSMRQDPVYCDSNGTISTGILEDDESKLMEILWYNSAKSRYGSTSGSCCSRYCIHWSIRFCTVLLITGVSAFMLLTSGISLCLDTNWETYHIMTSVSRYESYHEASVSLHPSHNGPHFSSKTSFHPHDITQDGKQNLVKYTWILLKLMTKPYRPIAGRKFSEMLVKTKYW